MPDFDHPTEVLKIIDDAIEDSRDIPGRRRTRLFAIISAIGLLALLAGFLLIGTGNLAIVPNDLIPPIASGPLSPDGGGIPPNGRDGSSLPGSSPDSPSGGSGSNSSGRSDPGSNRPLDRPGRSSPDSPRPGQPRGSEPPGGAPTPVPSQPPPVRPAPRPEIVLRGNDSAIVLDIPLIDANVLDVRLF